MPSRKMLESVIRGFLGTYVSRNSEFDDGRLLFGFVIDSLSDVEIDLAESEPGIDLLPGVREGIVH